MLFRDWVISIVNSDISIHQALIKRYRLLLLALPSSSLILVELFSEKKPSTFNMSKQVLDPKDCVIIEDLGDGDDRPGPSRAVHKPSACSIEADWFNQPYERPSQQVIDCDSPEEYMSAFQDLIWNKPHDRMVPGYGMTPRELASISSEGRKGWLVTSHFYWLCRCLNQQQSHTRCFVLDPGIRQAAIDKSLSSVCKKNLLRIIFVMSVGRQDNGEVYLGTDKIQGDHWSLAVVDMTDGEISYCDTLGWSAPQKFVSHVLNYTKCFGLSRSFQLKVSMAHHPNSEQHVCTKNCSNYPLQTCSDVCGVVAMVCIAVAALDRKLFELILTPFRNINVYLTNPTDYSSYLRRVLICWIVTSHIDIRKISLKPGFDPLIISHHESSESGLKRKHDSATNGEGCSNAKKSLKSCCTFNSYIIETLKINRDSFDIVTDATDFFERDLQVERTEIRRKANLFANFTLNHCFERDKDHLLSTKSYAQELLRVPGLNPLIVFKVPGKASPDLLEGDFALGIQTQYQRDILKSYGKKCICLDIVRESETFGFNLITVTVFLEGKVEMPCAWLISNRNDAIVYKMFFLALKSNVGELHTEVFIGDMGFNFYRCWIQVFPKPTKRMFCTWDVFHVLNNRMESFVEDVEFRANLKRYLYVLPYITNVGAFKKYVGHVLLVIKAMSEKFHNYLKTKFIDDSKDEFWASCYRHMPFSDFVPFLRSFSQVLKLVGFHGRGQTARLDGVLHKLLQVSKYLECKFHIMPSEERLKKTKRDMSRKHQEPCDNLDIYQSASGEEWFIRASDESNSCCVIQSELPQCSCQIQCDKCGICQHKFICSCTLYLLSPAGCRHIHFVHTYKKMSSLVGDAHVSGFQETKDSKVDSCLETLKLETQNKIDALSLKIKNTNDATFLQTVCTALHSIEDGTKH